jgi:PhnB protein
MQLNAYLSFKGNCEEAFQFYAKCFGGKIEAMIPHEGTPAETNVPAEWRKKIMHARMTIGDSLLMGGDPPPSHYHQPHGFCINIALKDPAEAERIFKTLAEGGLITMPIGETFWAQRFGMCSDRFGIPWMINVERASAGAA